jgi:hypothetical protein
MGGDTGGVQQNIYKKTDMPHNQDDGLQLGGYQMWPGPRIILPIRTFRETNDSVLLKDKLL